MIVAFFQNAYAASQIEAEYAEMLRYSPDSAAAFQERVRRLIASDSPNYTYRVVRSLFGAELCRLIWWDNASPRWGWKSSHKFPADLEHIRRVLEEQKPRIVVTFGRSASDALKEIPGEWTLVTGPHPAARHASKYTELQDMKTRLDEAVRLVDEWSER